MDCSFSRVLQANQLAQVILTYLYVLFTESLIVMLLEFSNAFTFIYVKSSALFLMLNPEICPGYTLFTLAEHLIFPLIFGWRLLLSPQFCVVVVFQSSFFSLYCNGVFSLFSTCEFKYLFCFFRLSFILFCIHTQCYFIYQDLIESDKVYCQSPMLSSA